MLWGCPDVVWTYYTHKHIYHIENKLWIIVKSFCSTLVSNMSHSACQISLSLCHSAGLQPDLASGKLPAIAEHCPCNATKSSSWQEVLGPASAHPIVCIGSSATEQLSSDLGSSHSVMTVLLTTIVLHSVVLRPCSWDACYSACTQNTPCARLQPRSKRGAQQRMLLFCLNTWLHPTHTLCPTPAAFQARRAMASESGSRSHATRRPCSGSACTQRALSIRHLLH